MFQNLAPLHITFILIYFILHYCLLKVSGLTFATAHEVQIKFTHKIESRNPDWTKINIGSSILLAATIIFLYTQFF